MSIMPFPISLNYLSHWNLWEAVREIVANAVDQDPNGRRLGLDTDYNWVCSNHGTIDPSHLIIGESDARSGQIGQFGEGLKMAMLVLTRLGLTAALRSGSMMIRNIASELNGVETFALDIQDDLPHLNTTSFTIFDWPMSSDFSERFMRAGHPAIVHSDAFGRHILKQDDPDLFVKDVWVCKMKDVSLGRGYAFGYNLTTIQMNRDRSAVSAWEVNQDIARAWASVDDPELLAEFWQAVQDKQSERHCGFHGIRIAHPDAFSQSFMRVFGRTAVIETTEELGRQAAIRGATVIKPAEIGQSLADTLRGCLETDSEYIQQMEGHACVLVPDRKLNPDQIRNLRLARKVFTRLGIDTQVMAYLLPEGGEMVNGHVKMGVDMLNNVRDTLAGTIKFAAHIKTNNGDLTPSFESALCRVGAELLVGYMVK